MPLFEGRRFAVIVCGGRYLRDPLFHMERGIIRQLREVQATLLLHGGAEGGDMIGDNAAFRVELPCLRMPARWETGPEKRRSQEGPARNTRMLSEADMVIALPGGRGTLDMIEQAKLAGVRVVQLDANGCRIND